MIRILLITAILLLLGCHHPTSKHPPVTVKHVTALPPRHLVTPGKAPDKWCAKNDEFLALNNRVLLTELTVAALSCDDRAHYSEFVTQYKPQLIEQAKIMRRYFGRQYKKEADYKLDHLVTRIANHFADHNHDKKVGLCVKARDLYQQALVHPTPKLSVLSNKEAFWEVHGVTRCR